MSEEGTGADIEEETNEEKSIKDRRTMYKISLIGAFIFFVILVDSELSGSGVICFLMPVLFAIIFNFLAFSNVISDFLINFQLGCLLL